MIAAFAAGSCATSLVLTPQAGAASTGTLNLVGHSDGTVTASGTATFDCQGGADCSWFPVIHQVAASQPCNDLLPWYVGLASEEPTRPFSNRGTPSETARDPNGAFRMCLTVGIPGEVVAQAVLTLPPPRVATLTLTEAKGAVRTALYRKLKGTFINRRRYHLSCKRLSRIRFSCRARWHNKGVWRASMRVYGTVQDGTQWVNWTTPKITRPKQT
jgi:hypothetical protein